MQRRGFLRLGLASAAIVAVAGGSLAFVRPGVIDGRLTPTGRAVFRAASAAVLEGTLPADAAARDKALDNQLAQLDAVISAFPAATVAEISQLLALLAVAPGRIALAGLRSDWAEASVSAVQAALQDMRMSSVALRQQAYHALRDLTNAAWYADPAAWVQLGYPGPREI